MSSPIHPTQKAYRDGLLDGARLAGDLARGVLDEVSDGAASSSKDWNDGYLAGKRALIEELNLKFFPNLPK